MINEVYTTINQTTGMLRSYAVDKLDAFQGKWLVSTTEGEPAQAQVFMNYGYYVSELHLNCLCSMTVSQAK
jgi:hypothetical protein